MNCQRKVCGGRHSYSLCCSCGAVANRDEIKGRIQCVRKAFLSGFSTSEISLWEGEAPAEPKISAGREMGRSDKFGLTRRFALPLSRPPMNWRAMTTKPTKAGYFQSASADFVRVAQHFNAGQVSQKC